MTEVLATDQDIVLNCEGLIKSYHKMNDGGDHIISLRIQDEDAQDFAKMMAREGFTAVVHIAMVQYSPTGGGFINQKLIDQTEIPEFPNPTPKPITNKKEPKGKYGMFAKGLRLHSFFRIPLVWEQIGSDEHYQAFCRKQPCAYTKQSGNQYDKVEAAHVRRVEQGAGTSIKNTYATIPLLASVHRKQHNQGESAIGGREWCDKARMHYVFKWAWVTLKGRLGYSSWADVPPTELVEWAIDHGVFNYLPLAYKKEWCDWAEPSEAEATTE
ncbi:MAG: hypothetical protein JKY67_02775 [Pseudomonadales bacterium]|nr:hypothetical protein [Pseudomonadales bacterium]